MANIEISDLPNQLRWLADAPLFIDADQVGRFHDAIVQPESEKISTKVEVSKQIAANMAGKVGLGGEVEPNSMLQAISSVFPFLEFKATVDVEAGAEAEAEAGKTHIMEFRPIRTPQRQLVHLTLHYWAQLPDRIEFVNDPAAEHWRAKDFIDGTPRGIAFIELPPKTIILPTAAEYSNGVVELLYKSFEEAVSKKAGQELKPYPKEPESGLLKAYWNQFSGAVNATQAMEVIEDAAKKHKGERIRWIDYRVLLTAEGDSLHLHVCPAGNYDTGVFAYNFVKRGYKHGVRLVGTLKAEPDMNVLAVYER